MVVFAFDLAVAGWKKHPVGQVSDGAIGSPTTYPVLQSFSGTVHVSSLPVPASVQPAGQSVENVQAEMLLSASVVTASQSAFELGVPSNTFAQAAASAGTEAVAVSLHEVWRSAGAEQSYGSQISGVSIP